ncbi:DUF2147 domain-containing protein [Hymenobacter sp. B81]|uniref:DUF2147 domain-containing protein n=1 Tax=Hymenobacter sp. B81 TaxID=3344878 RepID=UPI0037DD171C
MLSSPLRRYLLLSILLLAARWAPAQVSPPLGVWADAQGDTQIELYSCGQQLCGRIVQLRQPTDANGQPRQDVRNPNPARRTQPCLGLVVLQKLQFNATENRWDDGEIYDPDNGRTYSCYVRQLAPDRLEVKGYIGFPFVGRAQVWTRVR